MFNAFNLHTVPRFRLEKLLALKLIMACWIASLANIVVFGIAQLKIFEISL
jgi:hypothetical protein